MMVSNLNGALQHGILPRMKRRIGGIERTFLLISCLLQPRHAVQLHAFRGLIQVVEACDVGWGDGMSGWLGQVYRREDV